MKNRNVLISDFYCTKCGEYVFPIPRERSALRESGHLKKLYCLTCREEVNCVEVTAFGDYTIADFKKEFELGRFKDGQRVPISELVSCSLETCKYNQHGKCWNANNTFQCPHKRSESE